MTNYPTLTEVNDIWLPFNSHAVKVYLIAAQEVNNKQSFMSKMQRRQPAVPCINRQICIISKGIGQKTICYLSLEVGFTLHKAFSLIVSKYVFAGCRVHRSANRQLLVEGTWLVFWTHRTKKHDFMQLIFLFSWDLKEQGDWRVSACWFGVLSNE